MQPGKPYGDPRDAAGWPLHHATAIAGVVNTVIEVYTAAHEQRDGCSVTNIKEIAELAGVSIATVSRTLSKREMVAPATVERVMRAVKSLNYQPNAIAANLRRKRSGNIIVLIPDFDNPFFSSIIHGIESVAHQKGYNILLGEIGSDSEKVDRYTGVLLGKNADGIILLGSSLPKVVKESISSGNDVPIPLVLACERVGGLQCKSVEIDNFAAAAAATDHLIALGHQNIAMIAGPPGNSLTQDRTAGFKAAMSAAGLKCSSGNIVHGDFSIESGHESMKLLLQRTKGVTAVFCANDEMALGALKAIRDAGKSIPDDVSIIGFDDIRFARYASPTLTTIAQPATRIGEVAMRLMIEAIHSGADVEKVILPHKLIVRESTAAPRSTNAG